jgi:hypothetical protein
VRERENKVATGDFAARRARRKLRRFFDSLPDILAGRELRDVARRCARKRTGGPSSVTMGAHVIKVGLSPL